MALAGYFMQLLMLSLITHDDYNCPVSKLGMQGNKYAIPSPPMSLPLIIRLSPDSVPQ